ncbi:sulfate/molybdate ABC transporter ATP-binding protein [Paenibacillus thermotolerans]|uniref:sulfate/molybdate ABC transporter ATP-binding protein n=1 Tax=Paenibacillus thermotolerans TaxID=3027807 RepID=UPI0023685A16|nr:MULTISPECIES: sulfate ABC transporter ATP-binding protein [unclassified Paenibacillus]
MHIEVERLTKRFGGYTATDFVTFGIEQGKLVGVLGPSGGGKTTLMRMIAGLEQPDSGTIAIHGHRMDGVPPQRRNIGFVFQNYALFRHMTVFDNIAFGLTVKRKKKEEIRGRVHDLLELIGLKGLENRYPSQLSGGQRQRVAFARAIAPQPELLLLDEPFAAMDVKVRKELRGWLREMIRRIGITTLFVTHDQEEAMELADQILIIHEGRLEQSGAPIEIFRQPATPFVASFIGDSAWIREGTVIYGFEDALAGGGTALLRPDAVRLEKPADIGRLRPYPWMRCEASDVTFGGDKLKIELSIGTSTLFGYFPIEEGIIAKGEPVDVYVERLFRFDESGRSVVNNKLQPQALTI